MRSGAPIEIDERYVEAIVEMDVPKVVRTWNTCLDELSRKPKLWKKVEKSLRMYKAVAVTPATRLYPMTAEGWKSLQYEIGQDRFFQLLADSSHDFVDMSDWFVAVAENRLMSFSEDEDALMTPLAIFMKALNWKIGGSSSAYY
jgi:hypothetical protein